ncbi:MAG: ribosome small subunit-dependent GTPase A [Alphaproteobacteria bacterium CG_4_10_14_0_2_um_filter_63_37]|nr:MAG: ribosome small subunit-dependent GTPase A [Proteobacteria bacterium CG1_02_64_396]PJA24531.1 MAG: ribosome small subunit-dependent GTPase A [Alphaproteobacteria bacterium CG_4_10_14_0_2_um_filter_63_37]
MTPPHAHTPLTLWGWDEFFETGYQPWVGKRAEPGRIVAQHQNIYRVAAASGEYLAEVSGRLRHQASGRIDFPAVGDWVAIRPTTGDRATIQGLLPRKTLFARRMSGLEADQQVVAANIDTLFLATACDRDFNLRRLERYLLLTQEGGARPVVLLTKADLEENLAAVVASVHAIAPQVPVHPVSTLTLSGLEALDPYLGPGQTVAVLGSSGVGKSTLINALSGQAKMATQQIRAKDGKGRHTTTHKELLLLEAGGMLIDTPGMRELQLWEGRESLDALFPDVEGLLGSCRFSNCTHSNEPGCAIQAAIDAGELAAGRWNNYLKMKREIEEIEHMLSVPDKKGRPVRHRRG